MNTASQMQVEGSLSFSLRGFSFSVPSTRLTRSFSFGFSAWVHGRGPMASIYVFEDRAARPVVYARFWLLFPNESRRRTWAIRFGQEA